MAWRWSQRFVVGPGASIRQSFTWGGRDMGTQYFMAHPTLVGEVLILSDQTKASVSAIGGGIFYAATVRNPNPFVGAEFTWEGGGVT